MSNTTVNVTRISNKSVPTKYGNKQTFSFQGSDGEWYSLGFKKPRFVVGDEISFEYEDNTYGHQVDDASVKVAGSSAPSVTKGVSTMPAKPEFSGAKRMPSVFPIPALDGQRAIIRQNALTNARELYAAAFGGKPFAIDVNDGAAGVIIALARQFEAYTAGDIDTAMAEKMVKENKDA